MFAKMENKAILFNKNRTNFSNFHAHFFFKAWNKKYWNRINYSECILNGVEIRKMLFKQIGLSLLINESNTSHSADNLYHSNQCNLPQGKPSFNITSDVNPCKTGRITKKTNEMISTTNDELQYNENKAIDVNGRFILTRNWLEFKAMELILLKSKQINICSCSPISTSCDECRNKEITTISSSLKLYNNILREYQCGIKRSL